MRYERCDHKGHTFKTTGKNPAPEMATHATLKNPNLWTSSADLWSHRGIICNDVRIIIIGICRFAGTVITVTT